MAEPFLGEIKIFAGNFAPSGWAFCDGSLRAIAQDEALFNLIGTTYGGDGVATFALPDLRGRVPIHQGQGSGLTNRLPGESGGQETVSLTPQQLPAHTHPPNCASTGGNSISPAGNYWATDPGGNTAAYSSAAPDSNLNGAAIAPSGQGLPHNNVSPFVAITYIISLFGIFPSQS